jgi:hypothetical protein
MNYEVRLMEMKTIKQIEKICKADTDFIATILLEFSKALSNVYEKFEEDSELVGCMEKLGVSGVYNFSSMILEYWGFKSTDDAIGDIIDAYLDSNDENRMDNLKKGLIEIILETDESILDENNLSSP